MSEESTHATTETLHLFNLCECDYIVARDLSDAWEIYTVHCGEKREDWADDDGGQVADDHQLKIWVNAEGEPCEPNEDGAKLETDTAAEWARRIGRGYAFGSEY